MCELTVIPVGSQTQSSVQDQRIGSFNPSDSNGNYTSNAIIE